MDNQCKESFEAWVKTCHPEIENVNGLWSPNRECYIIEELNVVWRAWAAAWHIGRAFKAEEK